MSASLRDFVEDLRARGELVTIDQPIDPVGELGAALSLIEAGSAALFTDVRGSALPVLGNVLTTRERAARALGVGPEAITAALTAAIRDPIPPRLVDTGPFTEIVGDTVDLRSLPIPTFFPRESGAYVTAGVIVVQDVQTGARNLSFARLKILGEDSAMLGVSPNHHLGLMARRAEAIGRTLPIAVAIGVHPAVALAACLYLGFGDDELACAGALLGAPVDVALTGNGLCVPADTEIVLEGEVHPTERVPEGLVSEFHGRYHDYGDGYLVRFTRMTRRNDAMFATILPGLHQEHILLGALSIAAGLTERLRALVPSVVDVAVPDTGAGRTSAVIAVRDPGPGVARQLIMGCLSAVSLIKQVVVVDAEIDPWNVSAVEWARLSHARPERDFVIVPDARTDRSEPLARGLTVGKLGVDATAKPGERAEGWEFARAGSGALTAAHDVLRRCGVDPAPSALLRGIRFGGPDAAARPSE